ncbi:MAG: PQQ-dependent sugar dehydrogenase, partial [Solirubrobacteraceae bacterium]
MARVVLVPALLVALLVLVACGSDDSSAETAPTTTASGTTQETTRARPSAATGVRLVDVGRFDDPVYVTAPPGDTRRIFVVEQGGTIRVVRGGRRLSRPFLDLRRRVTAGGEQGLLSMAFAPDYARTRRFYVNYTDRGGLQRVVEFRRARASHDRALSDSARPVLTYDDEEPNHNGGLLKFGPDRLLYIGTGDGGGGNDQHGSRGNAQDLGSLLGKILRVDPRRGGGRPYQVPTSNPFVDRSGARAEIYSYGLRNPWRFSFDRATGDLT